MEARPEYARSSFGVHFAYNESGPIFELKKGEGAAFLRFLAGGSPQLEGDDIQTSGALLSFYIAAPGAVLGLEVSPGRLSRLAFDSVQIRLAIDDR